MPKELSRAGGVTTGYLTVRSRYFDVTNRGTMRLPVVKLSATGRSPREPVVLLAGGPGESTLASYLPGLAQPHARALRRSHDIILVELRGLKYAEPSLVCPELAESRIRWLAEPLPYDDAAMKPQIDAFALAHARLSAAGIDLNLFSQREMATDVIMAVSALGYDRFNLYGNSAGTILVQHIMREYPDRLRSVVMGSIIPPTVNPRAANPAVAERAFKRLFEAVDSVPAARRAYPNLEQIFFEVVRDLNANPRFYQIADPTSGQPVKLALTGDRLIEMIYTMLLLDAKGASAVPLLIKTLSENDDSLVGNFGALLLPPADFSWGVQLSAMLTEYPAGSADSIESAGIYPDVERVMRYWRFGPMPLEAARSVWKVNAPKSQASELVHLNVPTLLLSGELDPATPPAYAELIAGALPNAIRLVLRGVGHGPLDAGPCSYAVAHAFLDDPSKELDSSCLDSLQARFFVEPLARRLLLPKPPVSYLAILAVSGLLLFSALPVYAVRSGFKRQAAQGNARNRLLEPDGLLVAAALLNLVFIALLFFAAVSAASPMDLLYGFPGYLRLAQLLPLISLVPAAAALVNLRKLWRARPTGWAKRVYFTVLAIALPVFVWQLYWWRLVIPRL